MLALTIWLTIDLFVSSVVDLYIVTLYIFLNTDSFVESKAKPREIYREELNF